MFVGTFVEDDIIFVTGELFRPLPRKCANHILLFISLNIHLPLYIVVITPSSSNLEPERIFEFIPGIKYKRSVSTRSRPTSTILFRRCDYDKLVR